jgi:hypothetical protein
MGGGAWRPRQWSKYTTASPGKQSHRNVALARARHSPGWMEAVVLSRDSGRLGRGFLFIHAVVLYFDNGDDDDDDDDVMMMMMMMMMMHDA